MTDRRAPLFEGSEADTPTDPAATDTGDRRDEPRGWRVTDESERTDAPGNDTTHRDRVLYQTELLDIHPHK